MQLAFSKYEGLGNDFIVVEQELSTEQAVALCDRHRGIGGDGVLIVSERAGLPSMKVINADGSVPEMCGNGLRCAVLHVARKRKQVDGEMTFDTGAGPKPCVIDDRDGLGLVTVDMGIVRVGDEVRLELDGEREPWTLTTADAGNPHAITTRAASRGVIDSVGPRIATHPHFSAGTNVEFATYRAASIDLVVWERGVGVTHACGTGACATVAVGVAKGLVAAGAEITVNLPGGALFVTVQDGGRTSMRGPARHVFSGVATDAFEAQAR